MSLGGGVSLEDQACLHHPPSASAFRHSCPACSWRCCLPRPPLRPSHQQAHLGHHPHPVVPSDVRRIDSVAPVQPAQTGRVQVLCDREGGGGVACVWGVGGRRPTPVIIPFHPEQPCWSRTGVQLASQFRAVVEYAPLG